MDIKLRWAVVAMLLGGCTAEAPNRASVKGKGESSAQAPTPAARTPVTLGADTAPAHALLVKYLTQIREEQYGSALEAYEGHWLPIEWGYGDRPNAENLRHACRAGILFCRLSVRRIAGVVARGDTLEFTLEMSNEDGSRFEPPACCDEDAGQDTTFMFRVVKRGNSFKLASLPIYRQ